MLEPIKVYNNLSAELRQKLENLVESFGERVTYRFNIGKPDPHPDNRGKLVYPQVFTLTPATFEITDPYEKTPGVSKTKKIGAATGHLDKDGNPESFNKIVVYHAQLGLCTIDLTTSEGKDLAMMAELHPKHEGGLFYSKNSPAVFRRVDEKAESKARSSTRAIRKEALLASTEMNDNEIRDFAAGMTWDENEDIGVLRDRVEAFAEETPTEFIKIVDSGTLTYTAVVKRAFDKQIIIHIPIENKVIWGANQQLLAVLTHQEGETVKNHVELMADWLIASADGDKIFKQLKILIDPKVKK